MKGHPMTSPYDTRARKRPVNLTLNEDLVVKARGITNNLSGVVELLLADFVAKERRQRLDEARTLQASVATWNSFSSRFGSFADEHSTL